MAYFHKTIATTCLFLFASITIIATAQSNYSMHTIKQGETLSALSVKYATTVGNIMRLNSMNSKSQLTIGQVIKIPTSTNPTITTTIEEPKKQVVTPIVTHVVLKPETSVTITDIIYVVLKGQSLYGIAKKFNATEQQLKIWNNLKNNKIKTGQLLIVGKEPIEKSTIPVITKPEIVNSIIDNQAVAIVTVPKTEELTVLSAGSAIITKPKTTPLPTAKEIIEQEQIEIPTRNKYVATEGYFARYFNRKEKLANTTGNAAVFKTTSGWSDKKYYVLINDINQGSIVRLTVNNKSICAKVLGPLPDIKEDSGLLLRLSNSAAAMLGIEDMKFDVEVTY